MNDLSPLEFKRYNRHIILPEVGQKGQLRLKSAKVLIVGTGGLGSPISLYLAAAGVGVIGLMDDDIVDATNLQRQVVHSTDTLENPKVESAAARLRALNPFIEIKTWAKRLTLENGKEIVPHFDIIVDGTDNLESRVIMNQLSVEFDKPYVYGAVFQFEGLMSVFNYKGGPCYRCLFDQEPNSNEKVPGIFGVLPGVIGSLQATEVLKIIIGMGQIHSGKLLSYDALESSFRSFSVTRNPECPVCGSASV